MLRKSSQAAPPQVSPTTERRWWPLFLSGDGFGLILYYWALMGSLIGALTLVTIGVAFWAWWAMFLGLAALRCYAYLGHIGRELLDRLIPFDG